MEFRLQAEGVALKTFRLKAELHAFSFLPSLIYHPDFLVSAWPQAHRPVGL